MILFKCDHCGQPLQMEEAYAGRQVSCSSCAQVTVVPHGATGAAGEPAYSPAPVVRYCPTCGAPGHPAAELCVKCGMRIPRPVPPDAKSKIAAGLLGVFLGQFGVHRFYLGDIGIGIAQIAVTFLTCGIGGIWGFVEGILILTGSMNTDAEGRPLRD